MNEDQFDSPNRIILNRTETGSRTTKDGVNIESSLHFWIVAEFAHAARAHLFSSS